MRQTKTTGQLKYHTSISMGMSRCPIYAVEIKLEERINEYLAMLASDPVLQHDEKKMNQAMNLRKCIGKITSE